MFLCFMSLGYCGDSEEVTVICTFYHRREREREKERERERERAGGGRGGGGGERKREREINKVFSLQFTI